MYSEKVLKFYLWKNATYQKTERKLVDVLPPRRGLQLHGPESTGPQHRRLRVGGSQAVSSRDVSAMRREFLDRPDKTMTFELAGRQQSVPVTS